MLEPRRQQGFSLPELLIVMVLGTLLMSAVINTYLSTLNSTNQNNQQAQLNHNLRASIDLISSELKRAGGIVRPLALNSASFTQYANNPFMMGNNNLTLGGTCAANICDCVTYSYDRNQDGLVGVSPTVGATLQTNEAISAVEQFGFRLNAGALELRRSRANITNTGFNCTNATGSWEDLTEPEVTITDFSLSYVNAAGTVIATPEQLDITNTDNTCETGTNCLETRNIAISITGSVGDYSLTVSSRVRVRNDRLFTVP